MNEVIWNGSSGWLSVLCIKTGTKWGQDWQASWSCYFLFSFSWIPCYHQTSPDSMARLPVLSPSIPPTLWWLPSSPSLSIWSSQLCIGSNWFTSCKMKSEFTREACDMQLKVGITHAGAYYTNKNECVLTHFLSLFPVFSTCNKHSFYWCTWNTNEDYGPGNLYGQAIYQEISIGVTDKTQQKVNECFILHFKHS